MTEKTPDRMKP